MIDMVLVLQAALCEVVEDAGFEAEALKEVQSDTATLQITGMTCASCSAAVEKALQAQSGVLGASVNVLAGRAEVGLGCCLGAFSLTCCGRGQG